MLIFFLIIKQTSCKHTTLFDYMLSYKIMNHLKPLRNNKTEIKEAFVLAYKNNRFFEQLF